MPEALSPLSIGQIVDAKWRIEHLLGQWGMGAVYAAVHVRNQRRAAIKVLNTELARDTEQRQRLQREGYAANRVDHPGIVAIIDDGVTPEGAVYLVMERLDGIALDAAAAESNGGKLMIEDACALFDAWLEVVAAAHTQGVIHRDLKPENAFLTRHATLKVLDFGLAHIRDDRSTRLTATGVPMGTPAFMPPEQALALWDRVDARSDVFALGASFFTSVTGKLVHDARTMPELLVWVCTRQAAPVRSIAPFIPGPLAEVLDRALSFHSTERYEDARAMLLAFRAAAAASGLQIPTLQAVAAKLLERTALADEATTPNARFQHGTSSDVTAIRPLAYGTVSPVSTAQRGPTTQSVRKPWLVALLAASALLALGGIAYFVFAPAPNTSVSHVYTLDSTATVELSTIAQTATAIPWVDLAAPVITAAPASSSTATVSSTTPVSSTTAVSSTVRLRPILPSSSPQSAVSAPSKPPPPSVTSAKDPLGWN